MTLLYLVHSCPYPPHKGDRIRSFNILKYLAGRYDVKLVYPSFSPDDVQNSKKLEKYCTSVHTVRLNPLLAKLRCSLGLFTPTPLTVWYFYSKKLLSMVKKIEFDIALVDCSSMAIYVLNSDRLKIIDFVDVDYDKWRVYSERSSFPSSLIYSTEYKKLRKFENKINHIFDHCFVVSESEKNLLLNKKNVSVVRNGIDFDFFSCEKTHKNDTLIFSGAMNYFANIDGVMYFHHDILPLIKKQVDNVQFIIAGMNPTKQIRRLASDEILVTGYVPDIRKYLAQAAVCVVPLRIAKGIQNKVLEAMAMEVPVVATTAANGGIGARDGKDILLADSPAAFAQATVALLRNPALRQEITANAKQFVLRHFRWETNLATLDDVITRLLIPDLPTASSHTTPQARAVR
jgi:polysaccharide biosynthesis protein PslH